MTGPPPARRPALLPAVAGACGVLLVAATAMPWVQTGEARRSSYRLLSDLALLGLLRGSAARSGRVAWVLLPALAAGAMLLLVLGTRRWAGALLLSAAVIAGGGVAAVLQAPVATLWGVQATAVLAAPTAATGLVLLVGGRRRRPAEGV